MLVEQQDRLLNLRLAGEIDEATFARKGTEIRDRLASIKLQCDVLDRSHDENADLASKVFELSQVLRSKWLSADYDVKRRILEIVCLNCELVDTTLVPTMRKPFDVLVKGLFVQSSRGDKIRTCDLLVPNQALYQAEPHPALEAITVTDPCGCHKVVRCGQRAAPADFVHKNVAQSCQRYRPRREAVAAT